MAKKKSVKRRTKRTSKTMSKSQGKAPGKRASPRAGGTALGGVSTQALAAELRRRERDIAKLETKREKLLDQVDQVDAEIGALRQALGGALPGGRSAGRTAGRRPGRPAAGKRFRNASNLADALHAVLRGKQMGVTEAAEAVQAAGYQTTAANFRVIVNQTLLKDKRIKKVSRGVYTAA